MLIIVSASSVFAWYLNIKGLPTLLAEILLSITTQKELLLAIIMSFIVISGIIIHSTPMIVIYTPIFLPMIKALGISPYHFGICFVIAICVGQQTPPVATVLLTACSVGNLPLNKIFKVIWPFYIALIFLLLLIIYVPNISLFIPNLILGLP